MAESPLETLGKEIEDVEQGRLSAAVRPQEHGQGRDLFQLDAPKRTVVLDTQVLDAGRTRGDIACLVFLLAFVIQISLLPSQVGGPRALVVRLIMPNAWQRAYDTQAEPRPQRFARTELRSVLIPSGARVGSGRRDRRSCRAVTPGPAHKIPHPKPGTPVSRIVAATWRRRPRQRRSVNQGSDRDGNL